MSNQKPSVWAWGVVAAVVLLVLYPLSYGPWLWLFPDDDFAGSFVAEVGDDAYRPLYEVFYRIPDPIADPYYPYLLWWNPDDANGIVNTRAIIRALVELAERTSRKP